MPSSVDNTQSTITALNNQTQCAPADSSSTTGHSVHALPGSVSAPEPVSGLQMIPTAGDGRCLFRSLVIGMDAELQAGERNEHGQLANSMLGICERSKADCLRAKVIEFMCTQFDAYKDLDVETVNADLPNWLRYQSMQDRISAMSDPLCMSGEIEITAASNVLERPIVVMNSQNVMIQIYLADNNSTGDRNEPLIVQFESVGHDVGHYTCVVRREDQGTIGASACESTSQISSQAQDVSASDEHITKIIHCLSLLPKLSTKRPRTRKPESAAVLTSSPYRAQLLEKHSKKLPSKKDSERKARRPKVANQKKLTRKSETAQRQRKKKHDKTSESEEDEEWPCLICCEPYSQSRPRDVWVQCQICTKWAHEECTPGQAQFICPNCDSDDSE